MVTAEQIREELRKVKYPGLSRDIVSFGFVKEISVEPRGVTVHLTPTTGNQDVIARIRDEVEKTAARLAGAPVQVVVERAGPRGEAAGAPQARAGLPGVAHIVAVASGKGGVGKSTVAVNLALALMQLGREVGLLDADIYGPSVPLMLGITQRPRATDDRRIVPISRHGIKVISMGLFLADDTPVVWRGPMITKALTEFLKNVEWGDLDYLVVDLPPGTGDAQLTLVQQVPISGGVIVTTPQEVALLDVKRGADMFRQVNAPVLGVIENMSYHLCLHCGRRSEIFGHGGGARIAAELDIPLLGEVPLVGQIRQAGDAGAPLVVADPEHPQSAVFREIAGQILAVLEDRSQRPLA